MKSVKDATIKIITNSPNINEDILIDVVKISKDFRRKIKTVLINVNISRNVKIMALIYTFFMMYFTSIM